jgi:AcrR family transcriptional regulator
LSAGERLFLEKGYSAVTMDELAKTCELSKGTLYIYFKSKEELFYTIKLKGMSILNKMFADAINSKSTVLSKLVAIGQMYLEFYCRHTTYFKIVNYFEEHHSFEKEEVKELKKQCFRKSNELMNEILKLIEQGIKEKIFKKIFNPLEFAVTLWSSSNGIIQIIDHIKSHATLSEDECNDLIFTDINFEESLYNLWKRLISTVLVDPKTIKTINRLFTQAKLDTKKNMLMSFALGIITTGIMICSI